MRLIMLTFLSIALLLNILVVVLRWGYYSPSGETLVVAFRMPSTYIYIYKETDAAQLNVGL